MLDNALDHFQYLGSTFKTILHDVKVLAGDIQRHSWTWDHVCIPARWEIGDNKPHWPAARHDLLLYILVAFAPNSFMSKFLRRTPLKPKEGTNPLVYAAYFNKEEHAHTLLSRGARLNHGGWEIVRYCRSLPIEVAFWNRHYVMVTRFIEEGSTVPPQIFTDSFFRSSYTPRLTQKIPSSVARVLLQSDEFVESISNCLNEAALLAIKTSNQLLVFQDTTEQDLTAIIRRFIQVADEQPPHNLIKIAFLRVAIPKGYLRAAQYLLAILDTPLPSDLLVTLHHYSGGWKTALVIQFLIDNGADVLVRTSYGDSVLHAILWAPDRSHHWHFVVDDADEDDILEAAKLVIRHGCDPLEADSHGDTPLHIAIQRCYVSVARYLLTLGASLPPDLLVTSNCYKSHLSTAIIRFLVENGVDVLARTDNGDSVLHITLQYGSRDDNEALEVVKLLVGHGCDPFAANSRGNTPLYIAVKLGRISIARYLLSLGVHVPPDLLVHRDLSICTADIIRFLLENGVDVLACTSDGDSASHIVLESTYNDDEALTAIKLLVSYGCDPFRANSQGNTPLCIAVMQGNISTARYLLSIGALVPLDLLVTLTSRTPVGITARMVRFLVENGADPLAHTNDGDTVLHAMLQLLRDDNKALEAVKLLVGYGCTPLVANYYGKTPLHIAVERGHIAVARYLLTLDAALPSDLFVMLHSAFWRQGTAHRMIHFLLENGVRVNTLAHNNDGQPVLHFVLHSSHDDSDALEAVKVLVAYGCDPLEADCRGNTPLHIATKRGHVSAAGYFLSLGALAPPDLLVSCFPERFWARHTTLRMIHFLVENGVDVLAHTNDGDSVLHIALKSIQHDNGAALEVVKLLVSYGCDPLAANFHGHTPLHIAVIRGHVSAARYLHTLGVSIPPDLLIVIESGHDGFLSSPAPMIHFLVENDVDVLAHTDDGDSVLHITLKSLYNDLNVLEVVKILVSHGCDPFEANSRGNTPICIAIQQGHVSVARHLLSLGARLGPDMLVTLNRDEWNCSAEMVRFVFENGVDVLARTGDGDSAFHLVLERTYDDDEALAALKLLVNYGCDPLKANFHGTTPLHVAVTHGYISAARYLLTLRAPLPPDLLLTLNRNGSHWGTTPMIRFLFENGVDVLARTVDGDSAFHLVLECTYYDDDEALTALKLLVNYGCDPLKANFHGTTPLHVAVTHGHISAARYLLTLGTPLPPDLLLTLNRNESFWSTTPMIRFLFENGVDVHAHADNGDSVLHVALQCFNDDKCVLEAVKLLVGYGCDPLEANSRGSTPLHIAVERGHISTARYLLTLGALLPPNMLVALDHDWSCWSTAPMIRFLFENGVDFLARASNGESVLHTAFQCVNGDKGVLIAAKLLVGYGCDPLDANSRGEIPLHFAARRSYISVARYLIQQGANVLTKASSGDTVLHFATGAAYPHLYDNTVDGHILKAVRFFVASGCEPAAPNDNGKTPLHSVVGLGRLKTMKYLLSLNIQLPTDILFTAIKSDNNSTCRRHIVETLVTAGCDTQTRNSEGVTPLQSAIIKGRVDVVEYLLSVASVHDLPLEDLLSAAELAPQSVQSEMKRMLSQRRGSAKGEQL